MYCGSFGFSEYPNGKQKTMIILKEEQERAVKELFVFSSAEKVPAFSKWIKVPNYSTRSDIGYCGRRTSHRRILSSRVEP